VGQQQDDNAAARSAAAPESTAAGGSLPGGSVPGGSVPGLADGGGGGDHAEHVMSVFDRYAVDTLVGRMGIKVVEASAQRVVATMPVAGNTQPAGLLHGGASCVLAETIGSLAAALHAGPDKFPVGIEISATHHRAASGGLVTGTATLVHGGNTLATTEIVITDEQGRRVCTARLTCLLRDAPGRGIGRIDLARPPAGDV
jgi:1,4-dihydroxy-2-naphthoyl-CoA hydrolase